MTGKTRAQVCHAVRRERVKGNIEFEDLKSYTDEDLDDFIITMKQMQIAWERMNTRQVKASTRINETKPFGIAYSGDWHIGAVGVDYEHLDEDLNLIRDTEGLYVILAGDYKEDAIKHQGSGFEHIIQPGMQDKVVLRYMENLREKALAAIQGCFLENTPVTIGNGKTVPIQEIVEGDYVFTHSGVKEKVLTIWNNYYVGKMVRFNINGFYDSGVATANHKYWAVKRERVHCKYRDRVCKPYSKFLGWCKNNNCKGKDFNDLPEWLEADNLRKGDYLVVPKYRTGQLNEFSSNQLYLMGLFLAEGHYINKNGKNKGIEYTLHIKETELANKIVRLIKSEFGIKAVINKRKERNTVSVSAPMLGGLFFEHCSEYAQNKRASDLVMAHKPESLLFLTAGFIDGDAHQRRYGRKDLTITTISKDLAYQLHLILTANNVYSTLRCQNRKNRNFNDYQINIRHTALEKLAGISERVMYGNDKQGNKTFIDIGTAFLVPIKNKSEFNYEGPVYNLEVENDHSYIAGGVAVKNCHDTWQAKMTDRDLMESICDVAGCVRLWHGGEMRIKVEEQEYLWRCRHKYPYQSSLNVENAMRRIMEIQGPCDVAAEAHLHNAYVHMRHLMGQYRILLRTGSYKRWDEHGQQVAGYKGKRGCPVVILFPDEHRMIAIPNLRDGVFVLNAIRRFA